MAECAAGAQRDWFWLAQSTSVGGVRLLVLALAAANVACQHSGPKPEAPAQVQPSPTASATGSVSQPQGPAARPPAPTSLEALTPRDNSGSFVEIRFPIAEQRIRMKKTAGYRVRLKKAGSGQLWVALDDHRPRPVPRPDDSIGLAELVPADQELSPGPHWLSATLLAQDHVPYAAAPDKSRQPVAALRFWVEKRGERGAPGPQLIMFQPGGTYNGKDAQVVLHTAAFHMPEGGLAPDGFRIRIQGSGRSGALTLGAVSPVKIPDLPSGDYRIDVELVSPAGVSLAKAQRTIVVNRDAPVGKTE